ncbi:hypothetical protein [Hufsiella ginkgonis]|uniref:Lipoprotein n=1 Tax=Hufsiella ginkgonis TaxID=2695274 RepID=A0A7K1Y0Z8_9SPHI|nr:hypothetical protein [Hufsiella ginkgonis]MXV16872.1 hypothetical protein [Hufsiella ginkgonis]
MKKLLIWFIAIAITLGVACKKDTVVKKEDVKIEASKQPGNKVMNPPAESDPGGYGHYCTYESTYSNYQLHHPCLIFCRCQSCRDARERQEYPHGHGGDLGMLPWPVECTYYSPFHN